jgi:hypothetical protein
MSSVPYATHRFQLLRHPDFPCDGVEKIEVTAHRMEDASCTKLALAYVITGLIAKLRIPASVSHERMDGLWQHTCCEAFLKGSSQATGDAYGEFNFAPSTAWAAYLFESYRNGMANANVATPRITMNRDEHRLCVNVEIDSSGLPFAHDPWRLALSAVIEESDGRKSYWALTHRTPPDFHHDTAFIHL